MCSAFERLPRTWMALGTQLVRSSASLRNFRLLRKYVVRTSVRVSVCSGAFARSLMADPPVRR